MRNLALLLGSLACAGHARGQSSAGVGTKEALHKRKALVTLLLDVNNPAGAFNIPVSRHAASRTSYLHAPACATSRCPLPRLCGKEGGGLGALLSRQWKRYNKANEEHPWATKMATAAFLSGTGDIIAQVLEGGSSFGIKRFLSLITVNVLYIVPMLNFFYGVNERFVTNTLKLKPGTSRAVTQVAFDQTVTTMCGIFGFFWTFGLVTSLFGAPGAPALGQLYSSVSAEIKAKYLGTLVTNWKVWVLPQLFNFAVVPLELRLAFANCVALVWNVILSIIANK